MMLRRWIDWSQDDIWNKIYPPEIEYLFSIALPRRLATDKSMVWNYFPTPGKVEIYIYDPETIVAFKLKFPNDPHQFS